MQYRLFVGPEYRPYGDPYHYDWTQHDVGAADTFLGPQLSGATLADGATGIEIATGLAAFPLVGGIWVGGNGSGEAWEYMNYAGKVGTGLIGLEREPEDNREHNGVHSSGASVVLWWELTAVTSVLINKELNDDLTMTTWDASIEGVLFPQAPLRNYHLCIVQRRETSTSTWTNYAVGWLESPQVSDDFSKHRPWKARIVSVSVVAGRVDSDGVQAGSFDIARQANITASSVLATARKDRHNGDFVAAEPSFEPDAAVDGEMDTLWIAERFIGTEPTHSISNDPMTPNIGDAVVISQVHIAPYAGQGARFAWIEITAVGNQFFTGRELFLGSDVAAESVYLPLHDFPPGAKVVIAENAARFYEENPDHDAVQVIDLSSPSIDRAQVLRNRSMSGGALGLYRSSASGTAWHSVVAWGTGSTASVFLFGTTTITSSAFGPGGTVTAPTAGQTLRYNWSNSSTPKNNWTVGRIDTAGYALNDGEKQWLLLELPPLNLALKAGITSSYTGAITIVNADQETTAGLPASGTIQIGDEQMTYTTRTKSTILITGRGANSTTAAAHVEGDGIYLIESGVAISAYPVKTIKLKRKPGGIIISGCVVRGTVSDYQPRTPDDAGYTADYSYNHTVSGNTNAEISITLSPVKRLRWVLIEFTSLSVDPARPRLNEINIELDDGFFLGTNYLTTVTTNNVIEQLLLNAGIPPTAIGLSDDFSLDEVGTAKGGLWEVITGIAAGVPLEIIVAMDSKISARYNGLFLSDIVTPEATWTRSEAKRLEYVRSAGNAVSQVKLKYRSHDSSEKGEVVFPATPHWDGSPLEMPEQRYTAAGAASAVERYYYFNRYPYTLVIDSATPNQIVEPGQYHAVSWQLDESMQPISRYGLVKSVRYSWNAAAAGEKNTMPKEELVFTMVEFLRENA